jgi:hypothetical protein
MKAMTALFLLAIAAGALAQDEAKTPSALDWYKNDYALVYNDKPWEKVDEVASYYAETIHVHDDGGSSQNSHEWASTVLEEWKIEGWIRSELAGIEVDTLNPTTAAVKAKWRDYYTGGNIGYECGWYLVDMIDGEWQISEYATITCADHGL